MSDQEILNCKSNKYLESSCCKPFTPSIAAFTTGLAATSYTSSETVEGPNTRSVVVKGKKQTGKWCR